VLVDGTYSVADNNAMQDTDRVVPGKISSICMDDVDLIDAEFFGTSPREAQNMDPPQSFLLKTSWEALEDASVHPKRGPTSASTWALTRTCSRLPGNTALTDINAYVGSGNAHCVSPGRISFFVGLQGPSMALATSPLPCLRRTPCESLLQQKNDLDRSVGLSKASMLSAWRGLRYAGAHLNL
jgi:hypothetical protein